MTPIQLSASGGTHLCIANRRARDPLVLDGSVLDTHRPPRIAQGVDTLRHVAMGMIVKKGTQGGEMVFLETSGA